MKDMRNTGRLHATAPFLFVWITWAVSFVFALSYVVRYGRNVPLGDDWESVPQMAGVEPISFEWLWSFHNDHRIVLTKLLFVVSKTFFGSDFRVAMFFNVLVMATLGAVVLWSLTRWRGRPVYTDALIPLLFLHWGHGEVFLWGITSQFALSTAFLIAILLVTWTPPSRLTTRAALLGGLCLIGLPITGANGIALVPAVLVWFIAAGWYLLRDGSPGPRTRGIFLLAAGGVTVILSVLYFIDFPRHRLSQTNPGWIPTLETTAEFLEMSFGPAGSAAWPAGAVLVAALVGITVALLVRAWRREENQRLTILGLLAGFAAVLSLAIAIGWGRAQVPGEAGHALRYSTLAAPTLCLVYLAWSRYGSGAGGELVRTLLFALVCITFGYSVQDGARYGRYRVQLAEAFERDALSGLSSGALAQRYNGPLYPGAEKLGQRIEMLREAGWGAFGLDEDQRIARRIALNEWISPIVVPPPYQVRSKHEIKAVDLSSRKVLLMPAPGEMRIRVEPGHYLLSGEFGMLPEASRSGRADGVEFRIDVVDRAGSETSLWNDSLDPGRAARRLFHPFRIELDRNESADLVFKTLPGPRGSEAQDRSFWADVRLRAVND